MKRKPRLPEPRLSADALAGIFAPAEPSVEERFAGYVERVALDSLERCVRAETLAEWRSERRVYRRLATGLERIGWWPGDGGVIGARWGGVAE